MVVQNSWNSYLNPQLTIIDQEIKGCARIDLPHWVRERGVNTLPIARCPSRERT